MKKFQLDYSPVEHLRKLGGNCTVDVLLKKATSPNGRTYMRVPPKSEKSFVNRAAGAPSMASLIVDSLARVSSFCLVPEGITNIGMLYSARVFVGNSGC